MEAPARQRNAGANMTEGVAQAAGGAVTSVANAAEAAAGEHGDFNHPIHPPYFAYPCAWPTQPTVADFCLLQPPLAGFILTLTLILTKPGVDIRISLPIGYAATFFRPRADRPNISWSYLLAPVCTSSS